MDIYSRGNRKPNRAFVEYVFEKHFPLDCTAYIRKLRAEEMMENHLARLTWFGIFDMNGEMHRYDLDPKVLQIEAGRRDIHILKMH